MKLVVLQHNSEKGIFWLFSMKLNTLILLPLWGVAFPDAWSGYMRISLTSMRLRTLISWLPFQLPED